MYCMQLLVNFLIQNVSSGKHVRVMDTPLNPTLYSKTGVCRGLPVFLIFAPEHRLWILVRTATNFFFFFFFFFFLTLKNSVYCNIARASFRSLKILISF